MADTLSLYRTFARCVEAGSFSAVAAETHSSQPTISRQIAALEDHLGCLLFQRSTRSLSLTDDGRVFYGLALEVLDAATQAEAAVGRRKGTVSGRLRLACSGVFGRLHVVPRLGTFIERYPNLELDVVMQDRPSDLVGEGVDVALRVGRNEDANLIGRKIGLSRRVLVATPDYLDRWGRPTHPNDLLQHRCILYSGLFAGPVWTFDGPAGALRIDVPDRFRIDSTEGVRTAALNGLGIAYVPIWHFVEDEIETGRLEMLLPDYAPTPMPVTAVWPSRRLMAPKVRAAIDFFAAEFHLDPKLSAAEV